MKRRWVALSFRRKLRPLLPVDQWLRFVAELADGVHLTRSIPLMPPKSMAAAIAPPSPDFHQIAIREYGANGGVVVLTFAYSTIKDAGTPAGRRPWSTRSASARRHPFRSLQEGDRDRQGLRRRRAGRVDVPSSVDMLCEGVDITKRVRCSASRKRLPVPEFILITGRVPHTPGRRTQGALHRHPRASTLHAWRHDAPPQNRYHRQWPAGRNSFSPWSAL